MAEKGFTKRHKKGVYKLSDLLKRKQGKGKTKDQRKMAKDASRKARRVKKEMQG